VLSSPLSWLFVPSQSNDLGMARLSVTQTKGRILGELAVHSRSRLRIG
jgi:hypothetical protein